MKKTLKRLIIFVLTISMVVGATGCYSENKLWAAEKGDTSLSIGGYIYFLSDAYSQAAAKVKPDTKVLNSKIEEKDAKTWIRDQANDLSKYYFYLEQKFIDLGLEFTSEDLATINSYTTFYWDTYGYGATYEKLGISRESFESVMSRPSYLYTEIFNAMYAPDGEFGISDKELGEYYEENYYSYEYFTAEFSSTTEEGEHVDLTDAEKAALKKTLNGYVDEINGNSKKSSDMTITSAATKYQEDNQLETSTYTNPVARIDAVASDVEKAVIEQPEMSDAILVETDSSYIIARRLNVSDLTDSILKNESERTGVLSSWKSNEFTEYIKEEYPKVDGITYNDSSINSFSLNKLVSDDNKMGTSSESTESSEPSSSEETSEEESSETSS